MYSSLFYDSTFKNRNTETNTDGKREKNFDLLSRQMCYITRLTILLWLAASQQRSRKPVDR